MNCDRIAPFYRFFERAAFGERLQRHRLAFQCAAEEKRRALILGDGDGRFTEALALSYPDLDMDCIELSAGMVEQARKRAGSKVSITQGDVLEFPFTRASYDLVFTHFFLDCFSASELERVITRVSEALTPEAVWVVSDFRRDRAGWRRIYTAAWLVTMYWFFAFATGLKTRRLPDYERALACAGFRKSKELMSADGLIVSQWWQR
jgi:ubiquinone/menaquinone biosynthesis C-methylase UbiE